MRYLERVKYVELVEQKRLKTLQNEIRTLSDRVDEVERFLHSDGDKSFTDLLAACLLKIKRDILTKIDEPIIQYRGVWRHEGKYSKGNFCSYGGSLWHCNTETSTKPGDGNPAWQLAVKHGRDGRDGKPSA